MLSQHTQRSKFLPHSKLLVRQENTIDGACDSTYGTGCYAGNTGTFTVAPPGMHIKPENRFWIGIYGFTAFILLIAVSVFGWLAWTSHHEPGVGHVAGARPPLPSAAIPDEQYTLLAAFEAPKYSPVMGAPEEFQKAMRLYVNQDYAGAKLGLRTAASATPAFLGAHFYLGICLLLTGDHLTGIEELRTVTAAGDSPYLERARFYLAKGLLAEHDAVRAQTELESLVAQHGGLEKQAEELLAQIRSSSQS
jgi:hypothetical protein